MGQIDFTPILGFMVLQFLAKVLSSDPPWAGSEACEWSIYERVLFNRREREKVGAQVDRLVEARV